MPYEVINKLKQPSLIRVVDPTGAGAATPNLALSAFSANVGTENVSNVIITSVKWSLHPSLGALSISRDGTVVMNVNQTGFWSHDELNIANSSGANVLVTITGGGTALIACKKTATYNVDVEKL